MKLTGLTSLIAGLEPVSAARRSSDPVRVYGLLAAARPTVIAALAGDRSALCVAPHPQSAADLAEELHFWTDQPVVLFPALEALPYERVHLNRSILSERESIVHDLALGSPRIVVAPARALLQPVVRPRAGEDMPVLRVGCRVALDSLLARLVSLGYADTSVVDEQGTFARRGGVIDIFPVGAAHPVRCELFGNEVESLRAFDTVTQRSIQPLEAVEIRPMVTLEEDDRLAALESLMDLDMSTMNAEARTRWMDDLARLEAGASLDELPLFAPYLMPESSSIVDCLPDGSVVMVDGADEVAAAIDDLSRHAIDTQRAMQEAGDIPAGLRPPLLPPAGLRDAIIRHQTYSMHPGTPPADASDAIDCAGLFLPAHLYAGRLRSFTHDLEEHPEQRTIITSLQPDRVAELLDEHDIRDRRLPDLTAAPENGVTLLPLSLAEGWTVPSLDTAVFTDHELFGRARVRQVVRRKRAARETFFASFSPGDYVVHLEHGVGRFEGVTRMTIEGAEREFALIQYAGADRVYVPSDQLERLTRYIGVSETPPPLNKLGGGDWQRARQRAKAAAEDIARELLDLYSKRMARPGFAFSPDAPWQQELEASFPFEETPDQLQAVQDVKADMEAARPMDRLVCADVGYGKTEVAVRASFKALMDGRQVTVLVPTTILAQQHYETFTERFAAFPLKVEVLSRFRSAADQREILRKAASGEIDVLIGTHRILQKDIAFKNLGLLIIDEEQRFGVKHKEQLKKLRETIDVLTLTATPIPRTLHMTLVGIREVSVIETPPEGRLPVKTYLQPFDERLVREAVLRELDRDGQVYIVHNKVVTIEAMAERLRRSVPEARIVVAHGQMDERQLEKVMLAFAHREADVLLCSTIIENGLDIPNVNTIIVNGAQRLGLTQLYQLRGRVGRSANQAYAYLLYPRDARLTHDAARRMEAVFEAQDLGAGFGIAMKDLEIRGAGNLLGSQQSGNAAAVGFDLYTRMVADAVEALRGTAPVEQPPVTIDLPLTMYLPAEYVGNEQERLTIYRRLAGIHDEEALRGITEEMRDRFGPLPDPVEHLLDSIRIKLLAVSAGVTSVSLGNEALTFRSGPTALYDRVALYKKYGMEARVSTNVLRVPRHLLGSSWLDHVREILSDMVRLRESLHQPQTVGA